MKTTKIEITVEIELKYDENSPEFKQAFEDYRTSMDKNATVEQMLRHIAFHVTRFGVETMVECVGNVGFNGRKPQEDYCGVMVGEDFDEFDFALS